MEEAVVSISSVELLGDFPSDIVQYQKPVHTVDLAHLKFISISCIDVI